MSTLYFIWHLTLSDIFFDQTCQKMRAPNEVRSASFLYNGRDLNVSSKAQRRPATGTKTACSERERCRGKNIWI